MRGDPKLVKGEEKEMQKQLERFRNELDGAARLEQAEQMKAAANAQFSAGKWGVAVVGYLAGIWFLRRGRPPCPTLVAGLTYVDALRARRHAAQAFVCAQRDYVGATGTPAAVAPGAPTGGAGFERVDREGAFRAAWTSRHEAI